VGWEGLPRGDAVEPLGDDDRAVLADVREVLRRHNALDRFGVTLLHSHFDLGADETLVEFVDPANRVMTTKPVRLDSAEHDGTVVPTSFRLDLDDDAVTAVQYCWRPRNSTIHAT
jgi:hypothetical protein